MNTTIRQRVMSGTGLAAAQSGWTESRLVSHMRKRGAKSSEIEAAVRTYRENRKQ